MCIFLNFVSTFFPNSFFPVSGRQEYGGFCPFVPAGPPGPRGFARASVIRDVRIASDHAVVGKRRRWRKGNIRENAGSCYKGVWIAGGHAVGWQAQAAVEEG